MKRLTGRTSVTCLVRGAPRAGQASPCFSWECYPKVSQVFGRTK